MKRERFSISVMAHLEAPEKWWPQSYEMKMLTLHRRQEIIYISNTLCLCF